jgi:hypothetical protein
MIRRTLSLALALVALAQPAHAATTFEYLFTGGYPLAISYDGTALAGNVASTHGPFRWTAPGGYQSLGMAWTSAVAQDAWLSADGTRVASTIVGPNSVRHTGSLVPDSGWY